MIQKIAIAAMVLGAMLLFIGIWGRFWMRGALQYLQPGTRLILLGLGAAAVAAGYWFYFDGSLFGRSGPAPKVWSADGAREQSRERGAAPVVVASIEKPAEGGTPAEPAMLDISTAAQPEAGAEITPAAPVVAAAESSPAAVPASPGPTTASGNAANDAVAALSSASAPGAASTSATTPAPAAAEATPPVPAGTAKAAEPQPAAKPAPKSRTVAAAEPKSERPVTRRDGTVDVCALQAAGGIAAPVHESRTATPKGRSIVIRNALGEGQVREKLKLMIEGRKVAEFEISKKNPRSSVRVSLPPGENLSYSLTGFTEYAGKVRREVSGGGWLDGSARTWDVRMAEDVWDARGGDLFLEPAH